MHTMTSTVAIVGVACLLGSGCGRLFYSSAAAEDDGGTSSDGNVNDGAAATPRIVGTNIRITSATSASNRPGLAWSGTHFGVTWSDGRPTGVQYHAYFTALDADGVAVGTEVELSAQTGLNVEVAWSGVDFVASWYSNDTQEVSIARVDAGNAIVVAEGTDPVLAGTSSAVAAANSEVGLAWTSNAAAYEVLFVRLDGANAIVGSVQNLSNTAANSFDPELLWNGSEYSLTWREDGGGRDIYFARLDAAGQVLATTPITATTTDSWFPSTAWTGDGYGIVWRDDREGGSQVYFAAVDALGNKVNVERAVTATVGGARWPSIVWNGSRFGLAYEAGDVATAAIYFQELDAEGTPLAEPLLVSDGGARARWPKLAWTGQRYGVAWSDDRDGNGEVYFAIIE